jgi:hypothetical protein
VEWINENRLECATFHIMTPYPGTPLYKEMERAGRLLHRKWELYDTAHAVFQPRHMSPQELEEGYAWCYREIFSHRSIWRRRPEDRTAILPYLAMSYTIQEIQPVLALPDQASADGGRMAALGGVVAAAPSQVPVAAGNDFSDRRRVRLGVLGGGLIIYWCDFCVAEMRTLPRILA